MSGLEDNYGTGYEDRQYPFVVYNGDRTGGFVTYNKETAHLCILVRFKQQALCGDLKAPIYPEVVEVLNLMGYRNGTVLVQDTK